MIDKFLKAKHWQIFMITFGIPLILQMILMPVIFMSDDPGFIMKFTPLITIIFMGGWFGWFWSVAVGLQKKLPSEVKMKVVRFKIFLIIPLVYVLLMFLSMGCLFNGMIENVQVSNVGAVGAFVAIVVPLHLFSMFCMIYCLYFVAKTFKTVESQRKVSFSDFAGEFFMIWFFPIGIWIIQPKINKMIEN